MTLRTDERIRKANAYATSPRPVVPPNRTIREGDPVCTICGCSGCGLQHMDQQHPCQAPAVPGVMPVWQIVLMVALAVAVITLLLGT